MIKLNLGCGYKKKEGYVNVDIDINCKPDMVIDLNTPLPFEDGSVGEVWMDAVVSYINDLTLFIKELNRVCCNGAKIEIIAPHFSFGFVDPYHVRGIGLGFVGFINTYTGTNLKVASVRMEWLRVPKLHNIIVRGVNKIISALANANKNFCERIWCYWVGGFELISFEIEVKKD